MPGTNGVTGGAEDHQRRQAMVSNQLRRRDITDARVLQAMSQVPRHLFVPDEWQDEAYSDRALPIGSGQSISQPYMVALMLQLLALSPQDRVLEIGAGSGYQTALLSRLAAQVYSVEYVAALADRARTQLDRLGYDKAHIRVGDGGQGYADAAPYDAIVVAAAAPKTPPLLLQQLADGGRLVIPVGTPTEQDLWVITRRSETYCQRRSVKCRFVLLRGEEGWNNPA